MLSIEWHLGHVVLALRQQKGWTQPKLAKLARLNKATIVSVEQMDRSHGRTTYEKIAAAFGLTLAQLYALVPSNPREPQHGIATGTSSSSPAGGRFLREPGEPDRGHGKPPTSERGRHKER